jgi:hypothetical protein
MSTDIKAGVESLKRFKDIEKYLKKNELEHFYSGFKGSYMIFVRTSNPTIVLRIDINDNKLYNSSFFRFKSWEDCVASYTNPKLFINGTLDAFIYNHGCYQFEIGNLDILK